ncbi:hypothetical protein GmHk_20G056885 [Glycine max]|nr:hypothetical protein GmHk_20G056885 [Glycine max]
MYDGMMVFQAIRFDLFVHKKRCLLFIFGLVCRYDGMMVFQATRFDLFVHKRCLLFVFGLVCRYDGISSQKSFVQICSIGYLCDRQQQRRQQIVSDMKRTGL